MVRVFRKQTKTGHDNEREGVDTGGRRWLGAAGHEVCVKDVVAGPEERRRVAGGAIGIEKVGEADRAKREGARTGGGSATERRLGGS
ncbi:MAG: hypothetical protein JWQ92_2369 [Amnibacterium sp.]|nr:hypothetical protein [Amnibacterium sp.]